MRVCIFQTVLDPYKGANHLPLFAALSNVSFTIVCNRSKARPEDLPANVEVVTVLGRTGSYYYGFADARFASLVLNKYPPLDAFWKQFHILHFNQVMGPAFRRLRGAGIPMLLTIHHPVTVDREVAIVESSVMSRILWRWKYARLVAWQRTMAHSCDRVMTVSQTVSRRLQTDYALAKDQITIVPNGVDGSVFSPDSSPPLFDVIALGSFIHPRKGFQYLAEVYRDLADGGLRIADVGRRSDAQVAILKTIPGVTIHGTVDADTVRMLVRRSSVLLSTSLYEGFGLSLVEALACGRPAFAFGGGAVEEVLSPIDPTLVTPLRDTKALVANIEAFLRLSDVERKQCGDRYRTDVLRRYGMKTSAKHLQDLYAELVSNETRIR